MENASIDYIRLGMFLKQYRESAGYTQKEISSVLDVTPQSVSMWEKGKNKIDIDTLYQLCNLYKPDFSKLLESVSDTKNAPEPATTDSEAIRRMQLLINSFEAAGYVRPGEDLTDEQLRFCMALVDFLDTYFGRNT